MSCNKYLPHVFVLPEDDANSDLANGFLQDQAVSDRSIQILEGAGGWNKVLERFLTDHVAAMARYPQRSMVLLIDFDDDANRLSHAKARVPQHLMERVYILGVLKEPEDLKRDLGLSYEAIGLAMAQDCRDETDKVWGHSLLRHNSGELDRLRKRVRQFLFQPN